MLRRNAKFNISVRGVNDQDNIVYVNSIDFEVFADNYADACAKIDRILGDKSQHSDLVTRWRMTLKSVEEGFY